MGYLLKEALKTLCGVNQWSYAVFWKIGCQNSKLLIWEECYYEPASWSMLPGISNPQTNLQDHDTTLITSEIHNLKAGDKIHLLVNKMMMENHVNIVGEGLVGRVAFTGNHQWILSDNYHKEAHPPEVLKEMNRQFSAGMKTVAVIPVLPHGVVQFGSYLKIMENMGFVNQVTSLVLQLGYVPGVMLSENYYGPQDLVPKTGTPVCLSGNSKTADLPIESNVMNSSYLLDNFNYVPSSAQTPVFDGQPSYSLPREFQNDLHSAFQASSSSSNHLKTRNHHHEAKVNIPVINGMMAKAEVIPSNIDTWLNHHVSPYIPSSTMVMPSSCSSAVMSDHSLSTGMLMSAIWTDSGLTCSSKNGSVALPSLEVNGGAYVDVKPVLVGGSVSDSKTPVNENLHSLLGSISGLDQHHMDKKFTQTELKIEQQYTTLARDVPVSEPNMVGSIPGFVEDERMQRLGSQFNNKKIEDACMQPKSGDDLFDILGVDLKNQLFGSQWNGSSKNSSSQNMHGGNKSVIPTKKSSDIYSTSQGNSDSGILSMSASDHLLDAVVSKVQHSAKPAFDDTVSCGTTLTNTSSWSVPSTSLPYGRFGVSEQMKGELYGVPKYQAKAGATSSGLRTDPPKEDSATYSQCSSIYGSQISSWIERDQPPKQSNSVTTGYSKKPDETSKTNRKRLKPGENPRPRPKDRQMIQDRVKELREIVPNGAKCSIDALLERTIKHMLFLQSVTKHADKLKQAGESKIISKDGGLLLKDNFEGGATWAYEIGSQSMVCPIIVEDLNQPRQMLVEMLCEERGLFLEIADIIRGLGLTILKGVMETQNDKIWARFAVEANRDVTRMEIFLSLVRLLEQSSKNGENMMVQQYHQAPPVPVTGIISHAMQ